jgi:alpha-ketoglutarate-dependent taurine dioxygenase
MIATVLRRGLGGSADFGGSPMSYDYEKMTETFGVTITQREPGDLPQPDDVMSALAREGAVLLRGFSLDSDEFVAFSDRCCRAFSKYVGGGIRFRALDRADLGANGTLLSTTGTTQSFGIPLHGEMYYQKVRPDVIWFYCQVPPAKGGQTTIADGRDFFSRLSPESQRLLRSNQVRYIRNLDREDWISSFKTDSLDELRRVSDENEMSMEILNDSAVRMEYVSPAVFSGSDGPETFINSVIILWEFEQAFAEGSVAKLLGGNAPSKSPLVVRWDDGTELPNSLMQDIRSVAEDVSHDVQWQKNDIVLVDNRRVLHGRKKTRDGGAREIFVRLGHL